MKSAHYRRVLDFCRLGTELLGKLPRRGDGALDVIIKVLAIADSVEKTVGRKHGAAESVLSRYELRERTNAPFVQLFFGAGLGEAYETRRHYLSEHLEIIEVIDAAGGRLFFQEYRWSRPEVSDAFFHTPNFDFGSVVDALWRKYPTGLFLSIESDRHTSSSPAFGAVPARRSHAVSAKALRRLTRAVEDHAARAGDPWCFVAYGPTGTGKSWHCERLAAATGGRLLKIDAAAIPQLGVKELHFLLDALRPSFLLIDDFDRAPVQEVRARVLYLFEHMHDAHPGVTVAVTVNDSTAIDAGLLRSERIDGADEFPLPDAEERRDILEQLIRPLPNAPEDVARLAEGIAGMTEGFSHTDLGGLVRRFKHQGVEEAVVAVMALRALAAKSADASKGPLVPGGGKCNTAKDTPPT